MSSLAQARLTNFAVLCGLLPVAHEAPAVARRLLKTGRSIGRFPWNEAERQAFSLAPRTFVIGATVSLGNGVCLLKIATPLPGPEGVDIPSLLTKGNEERVGRDQ